MSDYPFFFTWTAQQDAEPWEITGGEGVWIDTAGGERWLDLGSLVYQANLGHGHRRVVEAIKAQADQWCLSYPSAVYPAKEALARALLALAPEGFSKVFFTLGGSEATENALKIARLATGRHKLLSRYRSYHGASMGALSLSGDWRRPPLEPGLVGVVHTLDCYVNRCPVTGQESVHGGGSAAQLAQVMELDGPRSFAAVFLEPVPGANGVLVPPPGYWREVREACDRHGALLVADEVLTGFGRTGKMLAIEHMGVTPDLITIGKGLTGGYGTLGAVLVHERVARHFDKHMLYNGLTSYAHPLGCAAALETLAVYRDEDLIPRAAARSPQLLAGLSEMGRRRPWLSPAVRGLGLLAALELDADAPRWKALKGALKARQVHAHVKVRERCLVLAPPLCISEAELAEGLARVEGALQEVFGDTPQEVA
jgi:taurine--2-oxoglutarate transaminase